MRYIRSFFTVFCFAIFGIGGFLIGTVIFPLTLLIVPKKNQRYVLISTVHYSWKIFVFVMSFFRLIKVKVENKEKIKNLKGRVVVANHPSLIDIVLLISIVPNSVCIVKGSLANNFFIKHIIRKIYIVNNFDPSVVLNDAVKAINKGYNFIIFPEGTRTPLENTNHELKLHRGFAQASLRAKAPILPIKIFNSPRVLTKSQKWYKVGSKRTNFIITILNEIFPSNFDESSHYIQAVRLTEEIERVLF